MKIWVLAGVVLFTLSCRKDPYVKKTEPSDQAPLKDIPDTVDPGSEDFDSLLEPEPEVQSSPEPEVVQAEQKPEPPPVVQEKSLNPSSATAFYRSGLKALADKNLKKGKNLILTACQKGHKNACHRYGWIEQGQGHLRNALRFYKIGCSKGLGKSCNNMGFVAELMDRPGEAKNFYSWGCLKKHSLACENLKRVEQATGIVKNKTPKMKYIPYAH